MSLEPQEDVEEVVREQEVDGQKVLQVSETWAVERRAETPPLGRSFVTNIWDETEQCRSVRL